MRWRAAVMVVLASVGCGSRDTPRPTAPSAALDPSAPHHPIPALDVPAGFERREWRFHGGPLAIADLGREPRRLFRYSPTAGTKQVVDILVDRTSGHPRMRMTVEIEVVSVDDRWITYRATLVENRIEKRHPDEVIHPSVVDANDASVGTRWAGVLDRAGNVVVSQQVRRVAAGRFMDTMAVPYIVVTGWPTEPIGVGVVDVRVRITGASTGEGTRHYESDPRYLSGRYRLEGMTSRLEPGRPLRTMRELYEVTPR